MSTVLTRIRFPCDLVARLDVLVAVLGGELHRKISRAALVRALVIVHASVFATSKMVVALGTRSTLVRIRFRCDVIAEVDVLAAELGRKIHRKVPRAAFIRELVFVHMNAVVTSKIAVALAEDTLKRGGAKGVRRPRRSPHGDLSLGDSAPVP